MYGVAVIVVKAVGAVVVGLYFHGYLFSTCTVRYFDSRPGGDTYIYI